jgi:hypothetical protein
MRAKKPVGAFVEMVDNINRVELQPAYVWHLTIIKECVFPFKLPFEIANYKIDRKIIFRWRK